ncbi:MAG: amidohydrolase family protein, partial [SAR202 cluster bacterium]|nr:amidohydrolase family protein [SAR202 cluster bacterium]
MIEGQRVIDFHGHVGRWDRYGAIDDADLMLSAMDSVGIDIACLFNIFHPDGATGNDLTAQFVARNPDRFVGFAYVSPLKPEGMIAELERAFDELNFVAIKLYPPYT